MSDINIIKNPYYINYNCIKIQIENIISKICLFNLQLAHNREWGFHNARVNSVAWSPNSDMVASGSLDTTIIIWSVTNPAKHTIIKSKQIQQIFFFGL